MQILQSLTQFIRRQPVYISWLIKGIIFILFATLLWYEFSSRDDMEKIQNAFLTQYGGDKIFWLYLTLAFMPLNWAAETMKWLHLIRHSEPISFLKAYKAVLAGVTFSIFTPNRVGEFGGRILFLKSRNAIKGIFSTIVGSWAQQIVLITFGFLGFSYFLVVLWNAEKIILQGVIFLGMCLIGLMFFMFLNLEILVPVFKKIKWLYRFPRVIKNVNIIRHYTKWELGKTLFWAFARYFLYSLQYYWIVLFFGINVSIEKGLSCIATIYLLQTSIPLPPIFGLVARGEIALKVWGLSDANPISILAATFTLWIINLIIPAFIGLIFILNANLLKSLGYEKNP